MRSHNYANGCRNKVCYPSKKQARGALRVLKAAADVKDPEWLTDYRCDECRYWHIGHSRKTKMPSAIKTVVASKHEAILIIWKRKDGTEIRELVTAPLSVVKGD